MAISKIKVANISLSKLGVRAISSFGEASAQARAISENYDDVRDEVLSEHIWTFAQKRAVLATVSGTPVMTEDGIDVIYSKPSDFIKLNYISVENALVKIEGNRILSDTSSLKIIYTYRNDDPTQYFPKFVQAFATRLAAEICFSLTNSLKKAQELQVYYDEKILPAAIAADSTQGSPDQPKQDEWLDAMLAGSGRYATTGETWHPY